MRPKDLSEFSYGYALTEALIQGAPSKLAAAPYFPSVVQEGKRKRGARDADLAFTGALLYVQFKLSDLMERGSATEAKRRLFNPPFFRMPLRASARSDQHAMLIELEATGEHVFYATPKFNTAKGLDSAYLSRGVVRDSCFFRPALIGPLPDQKAHWVSFADKSPAAYFCSEEPRPLGDEAMLDGRGFLRHLEGLKLRKITPTALRRTAEHMQEIVLKELVYGPYRRVYAVEDFRKKTHQQLQLELFQAKVIPTRQLDAFDEVSEVARSFRTLQEQRTPPEQVAYLARTFFGCEVIRLEKA